MSIISFLKRLFAPSAESVEKALEQEENVRASFKARCDHFKKLLSANKRALETMASLEEDMRGERFFSMSYVRASCTTIVTNVYHMIRHLHALTENEQHLELFERLKLIQQNITSALAPKNIANNGPLVLSLKSVDFSLAHEVGGKMASLGEAYTKLHQNIPNGFVVTASGYQRFLEANNLQEEINRRIQITDLNALNAVFELSASLQQLICEATVPQDLENAILKEYKHLEHNAEQVRLAVRSSAIGEDAHGASFAGQYRTELNVSKENLLHAYKQVVASKYCITAMTYRFNHGIPDDEVPMCVGCIEMINAESGGVLYSTDPMQGMSGVVINATLGLPKSVVDGTNHIDIFRVSRTAPHKISERNIAKKTSMLSCSKQEGVVTLPLSEQQGNAPSITDTQIIELTKLALQFEEFYGQPQDIEWAYDSSKTLTILQSRPLLGVGSVAELIAPPEGAITLAEGGVCASSGVGFGKIFVVRRDEDMLRFPPGSVLLVEQAHSRWAPVLGKASAAIAEFGGAAGHLASVAREYGVAAIFGLENAMALLANEDTVSVDADARCVYQGNVPEVLARKESPQKIFSGSPVHMALAVCVHHIVPLNLLYPESPTFTPKFCNTLHDLTRFCHEKAVEEMFKVDESLFSERCGKQLIYMGSKLQYFIINLENGFCNPIDNKYVDITEICSIPMLALWDGMVAVPWAGPPVASSRGLLSVVAESAANPELEITSSSMRMTRNYFMIDKDYCNLQASFGYHFCTVESQAGLAEQENYVNFHFKGGAANLARRQLRIHAIADILAENGFIVDVKEDALSARAEELLAREACELLNILGFLIIHTRQMDASLQGENSRTAFADVLRKGIAQTLKACAKE